MAQRTAHGTGGAVQIMTIHGSKGLEAPLLWHTTYLQLEQEIHRSRKWTNVLVTDVIWEIHPWRGISKPKSGLGRGHLFDDGQQRAERRRQFMSL